MVGFEGIETSVYRFLVKEGKWSLDKGVDKKIMNEQHSKGPEEALGE